MADARAAGLGDLPADEAIPFDVEARDEGLITPVLVGPVRRIRDAAEKAGVSVAVRLRARAMTPATTAAATGRTTGSGISGTSGVGASATVTSAMSRR